MSQLPQSFGQFPRVFLAATPTPLHPLQNLSDHLGIDLWIKRDDLTGLGLGGNKIRQLEYYIGAALAEKADTILITGAVQSNFVRSAAAAAAKHGLVSVLQLEERVPDMGPQYYQSGNVFLSEILGAEHIHFASGEDESGADNALRQKADHLRADGRHPYVIPLGLNNKPLGALGYVNAAVEIANQGATFDAIVVASGSGATHAGLLAGLRGIGVNTPVHGICVRRDANQQNQRMQTLMGKIATLVPGLDKANDDDILTWDGALAPGYGKVGPQTKHALRLMAQTEGLFLDPVYTAKTFAGVLGLLDEGTIPPGAKVLFIHTGGQPALFAYQDALQD